MALNIAKGEKHNLNLSKDKNELLQVSVGLGWDMARGLQSIDLDASAVLCSSKNITDIVYFRQKKSV